MYALLLLESIFMVSLSVLFRTKYVFVQVLILEINIWSVKNILSSNVKFTVN